jgi:cobalt-zinc-cadmium resistance protein CzcA
MQEQLKRTNFTFEPVNVSYQGGQINSELQDYNVSISTGIPFPTTTSAQAKFQDQKIELARRQLNITKNELIRKVSTAYYQLLFAKQRLQELNTLDSLCNNLVTFINRQYALGESTQLEKLSAEGKCREIDWQKKFILTEISGYQSELKEWTGSIVNIEPDESELLLLKTISPDTTLLSSNPYLAWQQEQIQAASAQWKLEKTKGAPSIQFGYFIQSLDQVTPFMGYTIGMTMPLIKSGQQGRVQSLELQTRIEEENLNALQRSIQGRMAESHAEIWTVAGTPTILHPGGLASLCKNDFHFRKRISIGRYQLCRIHSKHRSRRSKCGWIIGRPSWTWN